MFQVSLRVVDQSGNLVTDLVEKSLSQGHYDIRWNAGNIKSGVYYCILKAGNSESVQKMILVH